MAQTPVVLPFRTPEASAQYQGQPYDPGDSTLPEAAPLESPILDNPFLGGDILRWLSEPDESAATLLTVILRDLDALYRSSYIRRGLICREVDKRALWRFVADAGGVSYRSFGAWLMGSAPWSRSDCYAAMASLEKLSDIPLPQLLEIPRCNLPVLEKLSTAVRSDPKVLADAARMPQEAFTATIAADHPEQHVQARQRLVWNLDADVVRVIQEAIDVAMLRQDCKTREEAIEAICADYIATYSVQMQ